ncbi:hypothetical protein ACFQE1_07420 [Halobium palmae]|uniref:DUF7835 domain-containing protein n=1 Tax=Halobium palmae TaxID=1776492 RepID=A0ABD5RY17_9EURY
MSQKRPADTATEQCSDCGRQTSHSVSIELVTESERERNAEFSREPYRVTECDVCGSTERFRMNDA